MAAPMSDPILTADCLSHTFPGLNGINRHVIRFQLLLLVVDLFAKQ